MTLQPNFTGSSLGVPTTATRIGHEAMEASSRPPTAAKPDASAAANVSESTQAATTLARTPLGGVTVHRTIMVNPILDPGDSSK
mmetsp:Transcript_67425/g.197154  ORF Transcript_67425/g.197154 Transcript_67425/m.197154 type:complete len:84 (+) Transcript_67425:370-621(+)